MYKHLGTIFRFLKTISNFALLTAFIVLFFNWLLSIGLFVLVILLRFLYIYFNAKARRKRLAERYKSPEGIAELKRDGLTDEQIKTMQKVAEEDAKKGIFS